MHTLWSMSTDVRKMIEFPNMVSTQHGAGFDIASQDASTEAVCRFSDAQESPWISYCIPFIRNAVPCSLAMREYQVRQCIEAQLGLGFTFGISLFRPQGQSALRERKGHDKPPTP